MPGAAPIEVPATFADLIWPARPERSTALVRGAVFALLGACLLTLSAKVTVPGPIPMTLQTLVVLLLGAVLGARLAVAAVATYLVEGAVGLPVFTHTPPLPSGIGYMVGPTGGFLLGFLVAAAIVGLATDRRLQSRPLVFGGILLGADLLLLALGWAWLAMFAQVGSGATGIGFAKAFAVGVQPFLLGEAVKVALAAVAFPLVWDAACRLLRR